VVHVDGGDMLFKSFYPWKEDRPQLRLKAATIVRICNLVGLDAFVPGELEFTEGRDVLLNELLPPATFPVLGANAWDGSRTKRLFTDARIVERAGVRVLLIGLCNWDYNVNKPDQPVHFSDPVPVATELIAAHRGKVDLTVAVSHLGLDGDERLAAAVPGIDVIAGGHSAEQLSTPRRVGNTLLVQAYKYGKYVGRLDLAVDTAVVSGASLPAGESSTEPVRLRYANVLVPLTKAIGDDAAVLALTDEYRKQVVALHSQAEPVAEADRKQVFWFERLCGHCHKEQHEYWRTTHHARAMATLEARNAHYDNECIGCHTIGFRVQGGFRTAADMADFKNVQCEACHGPGSDHSDEVYRTRPRDEKTCRRCHDNEHDPDFDFARDLPRVRCPNGKADE